jgi:hypothetical protein
VFAQGGDGILIGSEVVLCSGHLEVRVRDKVEVKVKVEAEVEVQRGDG